MKSAGTFNTGEYFFSQADNVSTRKYSHWWTRVTSALIHIYCAKEVLIRFTCLQLSRNAIALFRSATWDLVFIPRLSPANIFSLTADALDSITRTRLSSGETAERRGER